MPAPCQHRASMSPASPSWDPPAPHETHLSAPAASPGPWEMLHVPPGDLLFGHSTIMALGPEAFYNRDNVVIVKIIKIVNIIFYNQFQLAYFLVPHDIKTFWECNF